MFELTGVLRMVGLGGTVAATVAAFVWTYLGGVAAVEYGWITMMELIKKAAVAAGVAGLAGLIVTAILAVGLYAFKKQLKKGKKKFIAW